MNNTPHIPVMLKEVISVLDLKPNKLIVDATFGAGGYSREIAKHSNVIGIDRDESAKRFAEGIELMHGNFSELDRLLLENKNIKNVDGIVFDIGVSSMQFDEAERGFSFSKDSMLDMRMDRSKEFSAWDVVNRYKEEDLANQIFALGGEKKSRRIARAIIEARKAGPINTTIELSNIIVGAVGKGSYKDTIHPSTRTFQAIRMIVNNELTELEKGLKAADNVSKVGTIIAVVTFHSLEDKIVKDFFAQLCGNIPNVNRHIPVASFNKQARYENLLKKPVTPTKEEVDLNIRSRSAKLRAVRRVV